MTEPMAPHDVAHGHDEQDVILTPDQRLRVFISSTIEELAAERSAARRAIEGLHLSPVWYESGARPHPPRDMYRAYLRQSDVFVGIYWQRYGWVAPGMDISGLEDEFRLAAGMPMLLYLKRPATDQEPRLTELLDSVRAMGTVSYRVFTTPEELERLILDDMALLLSERFQSVRQLPPRERAEPAAGAAAGNLPLRLTSFIGREDALAGVRHALERSRLVTVTGVGGVGKTRLSTEAAASVAAEYPDGCWLCELAPTTDADAVATTVSTALGISARAAVPLQESIAEQLQAKRMLIVLDNCEHVLDAAGRLAERLLQRCPGLTVLATSRERLGVDGERVLDIGPLHVAGATAPYDDVVASDAVRLFAERAAAIHDGFVLDATSARAVAEICTHLDGIPLAIELAAARAGTMSAAEMAGFLDERFRLLTTGTRTGSERHQTLRAVIDWSYSLLVAAEQACFARLGVFVGTFGPDAVRAVTGVCGEDWAVRDTMASLVAKSMVVREDTPCGETRYRLFESLRHYALDRLSEDGDLCDRRRRHAEYYTEFAERSGPRLFGPDELDYRVRVQADLGNLRAAVGWALDAGTAEGELAVRTAAALAPYALFEGAGDISNLVEQTEPRAHSSRPALRCAVLGAAAFAAFQNHGDVSRAERLATEALADGVPAACPAPAHAYATMILVHAWAGRPDDAWAVAADANAALDRIGARPFDRALVRQIAAAAAALRGDTDGARASAAEALELARKAAMPSGLAVALWASSLTLARDEPERALELVDQAIALMRAGASDAVLGHVLSVGAQLRARAGDESGALDALRESIEVSHVRGDLAMLAVALDRGITVLGGAGQSEAVATLAGMCADGPLAPISRLPRLESGYRTIVVDAARARLGERAFREAYERGAAMTVERAVRYALDAVRIAETDAVRNAESGPRLAAVA
jgi:predicted ATPase